MLTRRGFHAPPTRNPDILRPLSRRVSKKRAIAEFFLVAICNFFHSYLIGVFSSIRRCGGGKCSNLDFLGVSRIRCMIAPSPHCICNLIFRRPTSRWVANRAACSCMARTPVALAFDACLFLSAVSREFWWAIATSRDSYKSGQDMCCWRHQSSEAQFIALSLSLVQWQQLGYACCGVID